MAIERGNVKAMNNLGNHYFYQHKYDKMKKYFLMAIERGNTDAMHGLGYYYYEKHQDYVNMKKYYSLIQTS